MIPWRGSSVEGPNNLLALHPINSKIFRKSNLSTQFSQTYLSDAQEPGMEKGFFEL
jgi:hypothetical protein